LPAKKEQKEGDDNQTHEVDHQKYRKNALLPIGALILRLIGVIQGGLEPGYHF
jgi:hypothetical protein